MSVVPVMRPSWAWNYRWTIPDVERAAEMAKRDEHVSSLAREFKTTIEEIIGLAARNGFVVRGGAIIRAWARWLS
jgi:hypothetical protein